MMEGKYKRSAKLIALASLVIITGCIQLRPISLYEGAETPPQQQKPESVSKIVSPILFEDDTLNVWGIVTDSCKSFALVEDIKYKGDAGLKLKWNRQGCEWVGFGMGWDDYAGKDLEPLLDYAAFEFYVRTPKGKAFGLPLVLTLEDYSTVMAFAYTANKYFERTTLDENWQKVSVPLKDFDDEGEGIDFSNIKQLQVEMQQSGDVYIDDFRLVFYEEPEEEEVWLAKEALADMSALPITMFDESFINDHGWGLTQASCQKVQISTADAFEGSNSVHAVWDNTGDRCALPYWGVSWAKWQAVDIRPMIGKAKLSFYIKSEQYKDLKIRVQLEDFNRSVSALEFNPDWGTEVRDGWYKIEIPIRAFVSDESITITQGANASDGSGSGAGNGNINPKIIKGLAFQLDGKGEMYIDNLRWE
ncbi:MAG: hypothetical protein AAFQ68_07445 [Bacteroidota bacterium]